MRRGRLQRWIAWAILGASFLGAAAIHLSAAILPFDDAFIIFRYVDNFLSGQGAVYNPGERVLGVSCPLYASWLSLLRGAVRGVDLATLASRGNLFFLLAAGVLINRLMLRLGAAPIPAAVAAGAVLLSEGVLRASVGAMETPMYLVLMSAALLALAARRDAVSVLLASTASLARPEGVLLLVTVLGVQALDGGAGRFRPPIRPLLGLAPLAVWAVAATIYYGSPIPQSVVAKAHPIYALPAGHALRYMTTMMGQWWLDGVPLAMAIPARLSGGTGLFARQIVAPLFPWLGAALFLWILWMWWRPITDGRSPRLLALPVYFAILVLFYAVSNPLLFQWYLPLIQVPMIPAALAAAAAPADRGWRALPRRIVLVLIPVTTLLSLATSLRDPYMGILRYGGDDHSRARQMQAYDAAARWLRENSRPDESVAATEIGILGYVLERRILDSCGLVTPQALAFLPASAWERGGEMSVMPAEFVRATDPDFVVSLPAYIAPSLLASDGFARRYRKVMEFPAVEENPRFSRVLIYRKRD